MKKFVFLCLLLSVIGCTNTTTDFSNIFDNVQNNKTEVLPELKTEKIVLNVYAPEGILNTISSRLKTGYVREYKGTYRTNYEVYVGDYVAIPLNVGEDTYNVVNYPKGVNYDIKIKDNKLYFRSLYQGNYEINLYSAGTFSRKITIENKLNYEFTEQNNYDIISQCYNSQNLKGLNDAVAIHRIAFPNNFRDKELSFLLIDLASKDGNIKTIRDEINFLQKNSILNEYDKKQILNSLAVIKDVNYDIPGELLKYDNQSLGLNTEVGKLIMNKKELNSNEIIFLEKLYNDSNKDKVMGEVIGNWYINNGNIEKGREYLDQSGNILSNFLGSFGTLVEPKTPAQTLEEKNYSQYKSSFNDGKKSFASENYVEALMHFEKALKMDKNYEEQKDVLFYIGECYFNTGDYSKAIIELKKSLNLEKNDEKKAEIYYNIGISYEKLGDKEQARNYFTYVIQNYKNSPWGVKSNMHILEQ